MKKIFKKQKMGVRGRIILPVIVVSLLTQAMIAGVVIGTIQKAIKKAVEAEASAITREVGQQVERIFEAPAGAVNSIANTVSTLAENGELKRQTILNILEKELDTQDNYMNAWVAFEPNAAGGNDSAYKGQLGSSPETGRFFPSVYKEGDQISYSDVFEFEGNEFYDGARDSGKLYVTTPYWERYTPGAPPIPVVSLSAPVYANDQFIGVSGTDISIESLYRHISQIRPYGEGHVRLISAEGTYILHEDETMREAATTHMDLLQNIQPGEIKTRLKGNEYLLYMPINLEDSGAFWTLEVDVPMDRALAPLKWVITASVLSILGSIAIIMIVLIFLAGNIVKTVVRPVTGLAESVRRLAVGDVGFEVPVFEGDNEIAQLTRAFSETLSGIREQAEDRKSVV